ncbi:ribonuclease H-like domain-containing protein [Tanacetum coccineum]
MVTQELAAKAMDDVSRQALEEEKRRIASQKKATQATSTNILSTDRPSVSTYRPFVSTDRPSINIASTPTGTNANASVTSPKIMEIFNGDYDDDEDVGAVADFNNMDNTIAVSPIPTLRIHKDHPKGQILGDLTSAVQTRGKIQKASSAQQALTISQALQDKSWVEAMQEELLQFKLQKVWVLVDLPYGKKVINTKWVFRNKRDERSIVVKNKARLIAQGFRQEEGIDYNEVFAPVATIEEIRLVDPGSCPNNVYKVIKRSLWSNQAPRAWLWRHFLLFRMENGSKTATTPIESNKSLVKDKDGVDVDVHVYRSMIRSLMYLTASRPDIMFVVCAYARFQVTPKASHLNAVKIGFLSWHYCGGASLDRKSTTGGCQFLGIMDTESDDWIYGFQFHETKSILIMKCTISRDDEVIKIHTEDSNVAVTFIHQGYDVTRFNFLVHNMVAYLEKTDGNTKFHQIMDLLTRSSIYYALTISPIFSTSFVEQFWMTAKSRTVNNISYIDATVAGKPVTISEASIRSDLLFDDADGIDSLNNQAIFDNI